MCESHEARGLYQGKHTHCTGLEYNTKDSIILMTSFTIDYHHNIKSARTLPVATRNVDCSDW